MRFDTLKFNRSSFLLYYIFFGTTSIISRFVFRTSRFSVFKFTFNSAHIEKSFIMQQTCPHKKKTFEKLGRSQRNEPKKINKKKKNESAKAQNEISNYNGIALFLKFHCCCEFVSISRGRFFSAPMKNSLKDFPLAGRYAIAQYNKG